MKEILLSVEKTIQYNCTVKISDKNFEKWENGEIDDDELLEMYEQKVYDAHVNYDYNMSEGVDVYVEIEGEA